MIENPEAYELARLMRDTLKANLPTFKEPNLEKWAKDFAIALRNDESMKEASFVAQVIAWACSDSFWRGNIQSPAKLREKFDQLTAKMEIQDRSPGTMSPSQRRTNQNVESAARAKAMLLSQKQGGSHEGI